MKIIYLVDYMGTYHALTEEEIKKTVLVETYYEGTTGLEKGLIVDGTFTNGLRKLKVADRFAIDNAILGLYLPRVRVARKSDLVK